MSVMSEVAQVVMAILVAASGLAAIAGAIYRLGSMTKGIQESIKEGDNSLAVQINSLDEKLDAIVRDRDKTIQQNEEEHRRIWEAIRETMGQYHKDHEKLTELIGANRERIVKLERDE